MDTETQDVNVHADVLAAVQSHTPEGKRKFRAQGKTEKDTEYFERVVGHMAEIPDDKYEALPDHVKSWYENAAQSFNSKAEISPPDGFVSNFGVAAAPTKEKAPAEPKEPGVRKAREHNPNSIGSILRRALAKDLTITVDQAIELLKSNGHEEPSRVSVSSYVGDVKETLRIAAEQGWSAPAA